MGVPHVDCSTNRQKKGNMKAVFMCLMAGLALCLTAYAQPNVVAWGSGSVTNIPSDLTNAIAISGGKNHSLAFCADGRLEAWGDDTYGQVSGIPDLTGCTVVQLLAGFDYSAVLLDDGTVRVWGRWNSDYAAGELTNVVQITAANTNSIFALHLDGSVQIWGTNVVNYNNTNQMLPATPITNAIAIGSTPGRFGIVKSDGGVQLWGFNRKVVAGNATNAIAIGLSETGNAVIRGDSSVVSFAGLTAINGTVYSPTYVGIAPSSSAVYSVKNDGSVTKVLGSVNVPAGLPSISTVGSGTGFGLGIKSQ